LLEIICKILGAHSDDFDDVYIEEETIFIVKDGKVFELTLSEFD
jgi:hypothetical protein